MCIIFIHFELYYLDIWDRPSRTICLRLGYLDLYSLKTSKFEFLLKLQNFIFFIDPAILLKARQKQATMYSKSLFLCMLLHFHTKSFQYLLSQGMLSIDEQKQATMYSKTIGKFMILGHKVVAYKIWVTLKKG